MVDLGKSGAGASPDEPELVVVVRPRIVMAMLWATIAWGVCMVLAGLALLPYHDALVRYFTNLNDRSKTKHAELAPDRINGYVDRYVHQALIAGFLIAVVVIMLAGLAVRGKSWARWALLLVASGLPAFVCAPLTGGAVYHTISVFLDYPMIYRIAQGACLVTSLLVISVSVHKETRAWFRAIAPATPKRGLFGFGGAAPVAAADGRIERPTLSGMLLGRRGAPPTVPVAKADSVRARSKRATPPVAETAAEPRTPEGDNGRGRSKSRQR